MAAGNRITLIMFVTYTSRTHIIVQTHFYTGFSLLSSSKEPKTYRMYLLYAVSVRDIRRVQLKNYIRARLPRWDIGKLPGRPMSVRTDLGAWLW